MKMKLNYLISLVLFVYFFVLTQSIEPQEPHYQDGEHNPEFIGPHEEITHCIIESCSG